MIAVALTELGVGFLLICRGVFSNGFRDGGKPFALICLGFILVAHSVVVFGTTL